MKSGKKLVWILEDDPGAQFVYRECLELRYQVRFFDRLSSYVVAIEEATPAPNLLIADLRLPDGTFLDLFTLHGGVHKIPTPFVVVSSVDDLDILRECYSKGALHYLVKPFKKNELIVLMERLVDHETEVKTMDEKSEWIADPINLCLKQTNAQEMIQLTVKEMQIFNIFSNSRNQPVKRDEIVSRVWRKTVVTGKTLDVHLFNLRRKLRPLGFEIRHSGHGLQLLSTR